MQLIILVFNFYLLQYSNIFINKENPQKLLTLLVISVYKNEQKFNIAFCVILFLGVSTQVTLFILFLVASS